MAFWTGNTGHKIYLSQSVPQMFSVEIVFVSTGGEINEMLSIRTFQAEVIVIAAHAY
jgi:hypothetical protein